MADQLHQPLTTDLEALDQEIQSVMSGSRVLLEEMTLLLHRHSPRGNRRTNAERRSGFDRRNCPDRRYKDRRDEVNSNHAQGRRNDMSSRDPGRRRDDRRAVSRDRRLPVEARQQLITRQMDMLAERNAFLLTRKRTLLNTQQQSRR